MGQISTMATVLSCPDNTCGYTTSTQVSDDADLPSKIELLKIHMGFFHPSGGAGRDNRVPGIKAKMDTPKLRLGVDQQTWDQFMTRWKIFKTTMGVADTNASSWLFNCLDSDLGDEVIKANPGTEPQNMT